MKTKFKKIGYKTKVIILLLSTFIFRAYSDLQQSKDEEIINEIKALDIGQKAKILELLYRTIEQLGLVEINIDHPSDQINDLFEKQESEIKALKSNLNEKDQKLFDEIIKKYTENEHILASFIKLYQLVAKLQ